MGQKQTKNFLRMREKIGKILIHLSWDGWIVNAEHQSTCQITTCINCWDVRLSTYWPGIFTCRHHESRRTTLPWVWCTLLGSVPLYRQRIDNHHHRYCLFCDHLEGRPSRLKRHVKRKHPTVDDESLPTPWFRAGDEPTRPVPAQWPTPEPYSPSGEQNLSCDYVPTPKKRRSPTKSLWGQHVMGDSGGFCVRGATHGSYCRALHTFCHGHHWGRSFGESGVPWFCWAGGHAAHCRVVATNIHRGVSH